MRISVFISKSSNVFKIASLHAKGRENESLAADASECVGHLKEMKTRGLAT